MRGVSLASATTLLESWPESFEKHGRSEEASVS